MTRFSKILIANRGEIACRVARTARALGYRTVAVYSAADRAMPHVAAADQAVEIGPAPAAQSYLAIDRLIAAARRAGADAVHPGYGFLSENAEFAEACAAAGLAFIGPPAAAIRLMGNKASAKRRMSEAGVPCIAGYAGEDQSDERLAREAAALGYPVMVKAAAGGGGKGMRLVAEPAGIAEALRAARSEAQKSFGSGELILEQAIVEPRHVEIQIFADRHGNTIHLGERDCSIQRRHQKVIEEAPCPAVTPALRAAMGEAALAVARAIGYVGAGTIEFLLGPDGRFFFLEMNTRLQVEHPVTEMVTGLDLVAWQLRIAAGERLPLRQDQVSLAGHAIEARLYAEDPAADFLPQAGSLLVWEPASGEGLRVDHGIASGVAVSAHYDPLIAKIIAHGATREEARRRLLAALEDTVALGLPTNRGFLAGLLAHPAFAEGATSTGFIDRHFPAARRGTVEETRLPALAAALFAEAAHGAGSATLRHWRSSGAFPAPLLLKSGDRRWAMEMTGLGERRYRVTCEGKTQEVALEALAPPRLRFIVDGLMEPAQFAWEGGLLHLALGRAAAAFEDVTLSGREAGASGGAAAALAPMTGTIAAVRVRAGDAVRKGQCLVILEAMKMEHEVLAPRDGKVASVLVAPGDQVTTRRLLVELEAQSDSAKTASDTEAPSHPPGADAPGPSLSAPSGRRGLG